MFLEPFFTDDTDGVLRISAAQGSAFAKGIAGDFNPLHDVDNPRFCVPGDLLFALVLSRHGLRSRMAFRFAGMAGADTPLSFCASEDGLSVVDGAGKTCLEVIWSGDRSQDERLIETLVRRYVAFSGHNCPHILVPLMEQHGVMINTDRPLVIYERMSFELDRLDCLDPELELVDSRLQVSGRRGDASLGFAFRHTGGSLGHGAKSLILSGLRDHDPIALNSLVERYAGWQVAYQASCVAL